MALPQVVLNPLQMVTPVLPSGVTTVSVDSSVLPLTVNADTSTLQLTIQYGTTVVTLANPLPFTDPVSGTVLNQFNGSLPLSTGIVTIQITGSNGPSGSATLLTPTIQFDLIFADSQFAVTIGPPTGMTVYRGQTDCTVEWAQPTYPGFLGVRVLYSTDPSGVNVPYVPFGDLANTLTRTSIVPIGSPSVATASQPVSSATNSTVTTSTVLTQTVNFCSVDIPQSLVSSDIFYVLLSVVVEDPNTNLVYESQQAGPLLCGFVNLQLVNPSDFLALQQPQDIASRMITSVTAAQPNLDLTPRSELRDTIINPVTLELANASVREQFSRWCQSISAISQIDDADGDGISDAVNTSPRKQQIARAYGLNSTDIQTFIDQRFDILGDQAGVPRGGATTAVVSLTFFVYAPPTAAINIGAGVVVSTTPDTSTATATFITTGSASLDPANLSAFYDPVNGWWFVTVPAQAQVAGSAGMVGAGTIRQVLSGGPSGVAVTNLFGSENGIDAQSNADYAAVIKNRQITGIDNNSRNGYLVAAQKVPGMANPAVVAAGDLEMLRDWLPTTYDSKGNVLTAGRHIFGCVDIYGQSTTTSQQAELVPFVYPSTSTYGKYSTYLPLVPPTPTQLKQQGILTLPFVVSNFTSLPYPLYTIVELAVSSVTSGLILLGTSNAQIDNTSGTVYLDPNELALNPVTGTVIGNLSQMLALSSSTNPVTYALMARYQTGITHTPALQPVTAVDTIIGPLTGLVASNNVQLTHTADFLLQGGSNEAGDIVTVAATGSSPITMSLALTGTITTIDSNMDVPLQNGLPQNILSVRSLDASTLYIYGVDYTIKPSGRYRTYLLSLPIGSSISPSATVLVAYNKFFLNEQLGFRTDSITLSGSAPSSLLSAGFVHNSWLPISHDETTLSLDTDLASAGVLETARYIKVNRASDDLLMLEGTDYTLTVDPSSGAAALTRILGGGRIPDGGAVSVQYFTTEVFTVTTEYPTFVQQFIASLANTKAAGGDVLVKSMVASPVDLTLNVQLDSATTPATVDGRIRTIIGIVFNQARTNLAQASITQQVMSLTGVTNVPTPFPRCAKSDGSYDIGYIITTGETWNLTNTDPAFGSNPPNQTYITQDAVLQNSTIPSGGLPNAYVGLLFGGEAYRRATSVSDLLNSSVSSFYIIGTNDPYFSTVPGTANYIGKYLGHVMIAHPTLANNIANPGLRPFFTTFQVWGETGAKDITTSPTEYLVPGTVTINYLSS